MVSDWSQPIIYTIYSKNEAGSETVKTIEINNLLISVVLSPKYSSWFMPVTGGGYVDESGDYIILPTGSTLYGPYWTMPAGTYQVTYLGTNLEYGLYHAYTYDTAEYAVGTGINGYNFSLDRVRERVELQVINNDQSHTITISEMQLVQLP